MDTTSKYILMCEKAQEIQESWHPKEGNHRDLVWSNWDGLSGKYKGKGHVWIANLNTWKEFRHSNNGVEWFKKFCIWLPRQDQLQEMIDSVSLSNLIFEFYRFVFGEPGSKLNEKKARILEYSVNFRSMEQLWLAFVMKEKYHKVRNGKDWVKK